MDLKSRILTAAIALVLVFFVFYGIETFYPRPQYDDFCEEKFAKPVQAEDVCTAEGGRWELYANRLGPDGATGWCNVQYECRQQYEGTREIYDKNVFFIGLILGIALFIAGVVLHLETVSSGIMGGSVIVMFVSVMQYWDHLHDYARFIFLGLILGILIYTGYKMAASKAKAAPKKKKRK